MAKKSKAVSVATIDHLLKAMLVFARTVDHVVEGQAVDAAVESHISGSKVQVLRLLSQRAGQTSSQVARFLGVSKPAVSQIIDAMVRSKTVTRKTAKGDRREVNLFLTDKGKELFKSIRSEQRHFVRNAIRAAGGIDPDKWVEQIHEMSQALAQADNAFKEFCAQCGSHADNTCVLVGGDAECHFLAPKAERRRRYRGRMSRR